MLAYRPPYTIVLIIGTPKVVTLILGNPHIFLAFWAFQRDQGLINTENNFPTYHCSGVSEIEHRLLGIQIVQGLGARILEIKVCDLFSCFAGPLLPVWQSKAHRAGAQSENSQHPSLRAQALFRVQVGGPSPN